MTVRQVRKGELLLFEALKYAVVGGLGVIVNMTTLSLLTHFGPDVNGIILPVPGSEWNIRNYHLYITVAFLVANLFNFIANGAWTFSHRSRDGAPAGNLKNFSAYFKFLFIGLVCLGVGLALATGMVKTGTPISLPDYLDNSTHLRNRVLWANVIQIITVTPLSFIFNRTYSFSTLGRKVKVE